MLGKCLVLLSLESAMIKWTLIFFLFLPNILYAGVSVVGTRFIFNDDLKKLILD